jgi:arylsulfatase A-like enzyme
LDREVGFLIQVLKEKRLYEDTLIFLTADHGEQFREHGKLGHPAQLYDEQLHVPLIIKTDAEMPKGLEVKDTVSLLDLAPTIIGVACMERNESFTGQILPFTCDNISQEYYEKPALAFANVAGGIYCYRKQNWKFICNNQEKELYNLEVDPQEKDNIYKKTPEKARQIEREAFNYLRMLKDMHEGTELEKRKIKRLARKLKDIW